MPCSVHEPVEGTRSANGMLQQKTKATVCTVWLHRIAVTVTATWLCALSVVAEAAAPHVTDVHVDRYGEGTQLVVELTGSMDFRVFALAGPERLVSVIDLSAVRWVLPERTLAIGRDGVAQIRFGQFRPDTSRIVIDLDLPLILGSAQCADSDAVSRNPYRLILDLATVGRGLGEQFGQPDQVVGGGGQREHPAHPVEPAMAGLGQPAGGLDPAEPLLDTLAQALAGGVARVPGGAPVDPGQAPLAQLAEPPAPSGWSGRPEPEAPATASPVRSRGGRCANRAARSPLTEPPEPRPPGPRSPATGDPTVPAPPDQRNNVTEKAAAALVPATNRPRAPNRFPSSESRQTHQRQGVFGSLLNQQPRR